MSTTCPSRLGVRLLIVAAIVVVLIVAPPTVVRTPLAQAQIGVPGLFTCSDGSQSFSGCGGVGIGYCGGILGSGQACSGPGISTTSSGCTGTVCMPLAVNACPVGGGVRPGQPCGVATGLVSAGPWLPAPRTYGASGKYCTFTNGQKIWVPSGASPAQLGCHG